MEDDEVGRPRPPLASDERHEARLDRRRVAALGEAEPVRDAEDVRVHRDALVDVEGVAEDHVRGLAADAGQRHERLHRARHLAPVTLDEPPGEAGDAARLRAEEARRADDLLDVRDRRRRERAGVGIALEEAGRDLVDAVVGALGGEDRGDGELEGVAVGKGATGLGVGRLQDVEDAARALGRDARLRPAGRHGRILQRPRGLRARDGRGGTRECSG